MIRPFRDDEHLSPRNVYFSVPQFDLQLAFQDKDFIGVFVSVSDEIAFDLDRFELVVVQLGNHLRRL